MIKDWQKQKDIQVGYIEVISYFSTLMISLNESRKISKIQLSNILINRINNHQIIKVRK